MTLTVKPTKKELANAIPIGLQIVSSCRCSYEVEGKHAGYCGAMRTGPEYCGKHARIAYLQRNSQGEAA